MAFPLLPLIAQFVPGIVGSIFGSNAGEVTKAVTNAAVEVFGTDDKNEIERAIAADPAKALEFKSKLLDIQDREAQRQHAERMAEIGDTANARATFGGDNKVFWLGVIILGIFGAVTGGSLWGAFLILTDGLKIKDPGTVAAVFTMIGSTVSGVGALAGMVVGYFYGSSRSSQQKTAQMGDALAALGRGK